MKNPSLLSISLLWIFLSASQLPAVVAFQSDTFPSLDPEGWDGGAGGGGTPPTVITGGGPSGPADAYLLTSAVNFHLGMKNQLQWGGDYLAAEVGSIETDILADPLLNSSLRIFLFGPGGTWSTLTPVMVPANSGWGHYSFNLTVADMVHVPPGSGGNDPGAGSGVLNDTLASVQTFLFRHNTEPTPSSTGSHADHVTGALGFDNITAIPEPATTLLCLLTGALLFVRCRKNH